jgi:hypothetical protein
VKLLDVALDEFDELAEAADISKTETAVVFIRHTPCPLQFAKPQAPICIKTPLHVGMLPRPTLSGVAVEYDIMPDMLPTRSPTVIRNRRLLPVPDATMQAIDTSDLHSVASHDERPARSPAVCHIPKLAPVTVKLTDPVDPVLIDETFG